MKRLSMPVFGCVSLWLAAGGLFLAAGLMQAGDPIQFGKEKSKLAPTKDSKLGQELIKSWNRGDSDPTEDLAITLVPPRLDVFDPKREKMLKLKRIEDKNWIFLQSGELQEKEEAKMGVPDNEDLLVKDDPSNNWMFKDAGKGKNPGQRGPGQANSKNAPVPPAKDDDDEDFGRSLRVGKSDSQVGLHTERALDFRKLLEPGLSTTRASDKGDEGALKLFQGSSVAGLTKSQQSMREQYREFVIGTPAASSTPTAPAASTESLFPKTPASATFPKALDPNRFDAPGVPANYGRSSSPGPADWNMGVSGFGSLQPASLTPSAPKSSPISNFESSRARGMNSLGGH